MQVIPRRQVPQAYQRVAAIRCPSCQGTLVRERRRIVDRLHSMIKPVKRFRCETFDCQWVGNMADTDTVTYGATPGAGTGAGPGVEGDRDRRDSGVPTSFIVHMVLVAVAAVFVIVYSTTESVSWIDEREQWFGTNYYELFVQQPTSSTDSR